MAERGSSVSGPRWPNSIPANIFPEAKYTTESGIQSGEPATSAGQHKASAASVTAPARDAHRLLLPTGSLNSI
jgi:hypothetical protein